MNKLELDDLLDSEISDDEVGDTEDINEESHARLIDRVKVLYGSREVRQRSEASQDVSEFDFLQSSGLTAYDMLKDLNNTAKLKKKRNKILKIKKKARALPVPLPKVSRERLQRAIGYAKTTSELGKWDSIVKHNESADQIRFPLNDEPLRLEQSGDFVKQFKPSTDLETQVELLLSSSKHRLDSDACLSQFEEEKLKVLSKEEAIARLSELRRLRALMHTEALRNRRVRKIKSRKFHKIHRKDKIKAAIREFEHLKVTDPQKALEKLEELERIRREERVSLRHKRKSKWATQLAKTGKFDKDAQLALRERIELGRELETKVKTDSDNDSANDDELQGAEGDSNVRRNERDSSEEEERARLERSLQENDEQADGSQEDNPWLRKTFFEEIKTASGIMTKMASFGESTAKATRNQQIKYVGEDAESGEKVEAQALPVGRVLEVPEHMRMSPVEQNGNVKAQHNRKQVVRRDSKNVDKEDGGDDISDDSESELISESTQRATPQETQEEIKILNQISNPKQENEEKSNNLSEKRESEEMAASSAVFIDPEKVLQIGTKSEKKLRSRLRLSLAIEGEGFSESESDQEDDAAEGSADEERQKKLIQEAFAGDDVVEDFIKEQKEKDALERNAEREAALKQKGLDGDWVTPSNIHRLNDRKKKFLESHRKMFQPRAAIVHEDANMRGIQAHRVFDVPKGFTKISQFETVLKQPIGSMFNTPSAFQELIKPYVVTSRGKIIKPIDQNALVKCVKTSDFKHSRPQRKAIK
ncbi:U3 small nucleolar RNA-associated protein 14 homolog A-like isoform X1 [Varroa jacobsoni]|uniref:U3 small nucleolar RNA-associated protein 14 homolog A-like isoform X1 n=1 Tax=Varroa jacobsoni TaxID=62625 RepID=UPI000BF77CC6|nr:U3 small nucleolar RNA-associated protein 14 homolog A-like isoform X1 [Varroa jacobsoni]